MRKIDTSDVFEALRLIQKSGLKEKLVPVVKNISKADDTIDTGIIGILSVIEVFAESKCEKMIYEWLSGPLEMPPDLIAKMDLDTLADNLEALGRENNLQRFFTALSGLLSKKQ